jgi:hypothetical protein
MLTCNTMFYVLYQAISAIYDQDENYNNAFNFINKRILSMILFIPPICINGINSFHNDRENVSSFDCLSLL